MNPIEGMPQWLILGPTPFCVVKLHNLLFQQLHNATVYLSAFLGLKWGRKSPLYNVLSQSHLEPLPASASLH